MTSISWGAALGGLAAGILFGAPAMAQVSNCDALRTQTDALVKSYANAAAGLTQKLEAYNTQAEALAGVYAGQANAIALFQQISAGTVEGSASDIIGAEEGRLDADAMREAGTRLSAAVEAVNTHLETLSVQKPAMDAALGILASQCAGEPAASDGATLQTASAGVPAGPDTPAPAGSNPQAGKIPTVFANYWKHDVSGRIYEGFGQTLLRNGNIAVEVDCDGFGTVRNQPGKLCTGDWFDQSGNRAGEYRAVYVINSDTKLPMLHGELTTQAAPDTWAAWDFYEMTQDQAEQEGLIEAAP